MSETVTNGASRRKDVDQQIREVVHNVLLSRTRLIESLADTRRDIRAECGHPDIITPQMYLDMYEREAIPNRVVQVWPKETWQVYPRVYEKERENIITPFEEDWDNLNRDLGEQHSYYKDEKGLQVWEVLRRADILSGIGHYGILLLGLDDQRGLSSPASSGTNTAPRKLLYLRAFPEAQAQISAFETDPTNKRYGRPTEYTIQLSDPTSYVPGVNGVTIASREVKVHWTRVVHLADNISSSPTFGSPRQEPVFNRLLDIQKLYGGSAEMYWKGAFPGLSLETPPQLGTDIDIDDEAVKEAMELYMNGLQRYLRLVGLSAKQLAPQVVDPTPQIRAQIEAICIKLAIPIRVFMGSERGELASTQDDAAWNDRVRERQHGYVSPSVIAPFVDRLIELKVLRAPERYTIYWPDLTSQTDEQKAKIIQSKTQALSQFVGSQVELAFPLPHYLTMIFGLTPAEAEVITTDVKKIQAQKKAEEEAAAKAEQSTAAADQLTGQDGKPPVQKPLDGSPPGDAKEGQTTPAPQT